jgi:restriction system protein
MGYRTVLTKAARDGGRDVIAERNAPGTRERVLVECKLYEKTSVGYEHVMKLLGVVTKEPACRGVIVTTGHVTDAARTADPRVEVIDRIHLIRLLNENFGSKWPLHLDRIVSESVRAQSSTFSPPVSEDDAG